METNTGASLQAKLAELIPLLNFLTEEFQDNLREAVWQPERMPSLLDKQMLTYSEIRVILVQLTFGQTKMIEKFDRLLFEMYLQIILYKQRIKYGQTSTLQMLDLPIRLDHLTK